MALTGLVAANNLGDVVDIEKTWDNIGNNISATVFVPSPTLDLNFASNKNLVDNVSGQNLVTYSRASTGTFVGSNGLIQTAASGVPRFDHNLATGECLGLLTEDARTNYLTSSSSPGAFGPGGGVSFVNNGIGLDGITNGTTVTISSGQGNTGLRWSSFGGDGSNTRSFHVKILSNNTTTIAGQGGTGDSFYWDLSNLTYTGEPRHPTGGVYSLGNGWYRCWIGPNGPGGDTQPYMCPTAVGTYLFWGFQVENGTFPTSYIPTSGSQVTRAADSASISGSNFSSWFNQSTGTIYAEAQAFGYLSLMSFGVGLSDYQTTQYAIGSNSETYGNFPNRNSPSYQELSVRVAGYWTDSKVMGRYGISYSPPYWSASYGNNPPISANVTGVTRSDFASMWIGKTHAAAGSLHRIKRITYYPSQVSSLTLRTLTTSGPVSSFPYSFSIKGRDILALKEVNKTSTRDFIFTKGLLSKAQPRLTTASQYTSSGVALRDAAMPKFAPVTRGNYLFSSGLTLSGATVQINGTNALSIATSPFSSSTATVPLLFAGLRPQANWRISETMASGVVASPESAIPIATGDFLLFMKAGQS